MLVAQYVVAETLRKTNTDIKKIKCNYVIKKKKVGSMDLNCIQNLKRNASP
jgi:hypothetical protein